MKTTGKTLLIFSPAFPTGEADSAWVPWLHTLVTAFNRNFPALKIIVFAFQYPYTIKCYEWHNNKVIPFNGMHKKRMAKLKMWIDIFFKTRRLKQQHNIIGILSIWCGECTFVAKYTARFSGLKYYCWIAGQDARKTNTLVKRIRPKPGALIAMSDFLVDEFYKNHHIKPKHLIPNAIDTSLFKAMPANKDIDVIGVGSLNALKQYDIFVKMIAALKIKFPAIKSVLCGDGEEREHIEKLIKELSLEDNVYITGFLQHEEGLQMMQRAKILLHPSSYEGFGTVCIEALYAGVHVISFVQPVYHEIKNWHIVNTPEEMQDKAMKLLNDVNTTYESVLVYSTDDTAKAFMRLFGYI